MCAASVGLQVGRVQEANRVAVAGDPVDRLAEPLHLPALEREGPWVDHGLVADVDEAHPRRLVGRQPLLARAHDAEAPAVAVDVAPERIPDVPALGEGADRVRGDEAHAAEDRVGDQRVAMEEPLLVVAQGEVVERAGAVAADDVTRAELSGAPAHRGTARRESAVHDRPGEQVQGHHDETEPDGQQTDGGVAIDGGGKGHPTHADETLGRSQEHIGPAGELVVMHARGHFDRREAAQGRDHATDGENDEGGHDRGGLGLGPEEVALDEQQGEHPGAHHESDDVRSVDEVQGQCGDKER